MARTKLFSQHATYIPPKELVQLLIHRGLIIQDEFRAERYLQNIGYFRLSEYMHPLLKEPKEEHIFKESTDLNKILSLYRFDKKLRLLIFNEIEKIEIAIRSAIINIICEETNDPLWIHNKSYFINQKEFDKSWNIIFIEYKRSKEDFVNDFKRNHAATDYPPTWVIAELISFGSLVKIFTNIKKDKYKKRVAKHFKLNTILFNSWVKTIVLTRNTCCHHNRIWNKENAILPVIPKDEKDKSNLLGNKRIYFNIYIIKRFLDIISPNNDMKDKILSLLDKFPMIDISSMGFPEDWQSQPIWLKGNH